MRKHVGIHVTTVTISKICPKCGAERAIKVWKALNYDEDKAVTVDTWVNECGHVDLYEDVLEEFYLNPIAVPNYVN